jgi:hypothetical protein
MEAAEEPLQFGPAAFVAGLRRLGYEVDDSIPADFPLPDGYGFVRLRYCVKLGSRRGEVISIGFVAPGDFPATPPGGIYVHGELRPLSQSQELPHGGVSDAPQLGTGWRYWSRAHDSWAQSSRDAASWMAHVHRLFVDL